MPPESTLTKGLPDGLADASGSSVSSVTTSAAGNNTAGGSGSHNNMQPFAVMNYIIKY